MKNEATLVLEKHLEELGLRFIRECQFYTVRKWRSDFYILAHRVLIEIEGGVWVNGRHIRGTGYLADLEKYNTASMMGYRLLRFSIQQVLNGEAKAFIKEWLK